MLADDGKQPILMDFGSAVPARLLIKNRSMALAEQDRAGEHSTMPYRAPELFDVCRRSASSLSLAGQGRLDARREGRHLVARLPALRVRVRLLAFRSVGARQLD